MADVKERVEAELENMTRALSELPSDLSCDALSPLERAGIGSLLHSFYNGVENVLKQVLSSRDIELPTGPSWHRDLLNAARISGIVSETLAEDLKRYLAFRHFFSHGYAVDLMADRIEPLARDAAEVFRRFQNEIKKNLRG